MRLVEALAVILASEVRICIVAMLNPVDLSFSEIQDRCSKDLNREISDGSLDFHLKRLQLAEVIKKRDNKRYILTKNGKKLIKAVKDIKDEIELDIEIL